MARRTLITDVDRRNRLAWRHHLVGPAFTNDIARITDDVVALHSSDPVTVHLAAAMRMVDPDLRRIDRALYGSHTALRHHAMRRTLWVMTPTTAALAHSSSTIKVARAEVRRHEKAIGWPADRISAAIELVAAAATDSPTSTRQLAARLPDLDQQVTIGAGTKWEATVNALSRVLMLAGMEGRILRDRPESWNTSQYRWVAPWVDFPTSTGGHPEMLARWLGRFGPGTETDLVWWTGWTKTAVRKALASIDAVEVDLEGGSAGWVLPDDLESEKQPPRWVALLPGLDPTAMGWKERGWYLGESAERRVVDRNGNIGPTIWADGRVVGGWVQRPSGRIAVELYDSVDQRLLEAAIDRVAALVGDDRFKFRFPAPNQPDLLG